MAMRRKIILAVATLLALALVPIAYFVVTRFLVYQPAVSRIVLNLSPEETQLSPTVADVFTKLDGRAMPWLVSRSLLWELAPAQVRIGEWHLRGLVWQTLLPLRLSQHQMLALYAHYMYLGGGSGVGYGSRRYFGKPPNQLSVEEAVGLVAIYRSPRRNSPELHPDNFRAAQAQLMARYRGAA